MTADENGTDRTDESPGPRAPGLSAKLRALIERTKGFMPAAEGTALTRLAAEALRIGPVLEIGSYCGKSALYLGAAARIPGDVVFTLDHHRGSEETQPGWEHHDPETVDPATGRIDTLPFLRQAIAEAGLEDVVVPIVGESATVAHHWRTPLGMLFIDGGHGAEVASADYDGWAHWVAGGGMLAIHDVFPDPADGGQPPYHLWLRALESGAYAEAGREGSLRWLRRTTGNACDPVG